MSDITSIPEWDKLTRIRNIPRSERYKEKIEEFINLNLGEILRLRQELEEANIAKDEAEYFGKINHQHVVEMLSEIKALRNTPSDREVVLKAVDAIKPSKYSGQPDDIPEGLAGYCEAVCALVEYAETLDK